MKKIFLFAAALAAMTLASCNKELTGGRDGKPIEVTVNVNGALGTKATDIVYSSHEGVVNSLQVFVFDNGNKEAYKSTSTSLSLNVPATSGERTVWAVVNASDLSTISTEDALKATVTRLSNNAVGSFVMAGNVTMELTDGATVPVSVRRFVSRVSISKISTDFPAGSYRENFSVKVKSMYLINVAGDNSYDLSAGPSLWLNQLAHNSTDYDAFLYDVLTDVVVKNGTSYSKEHVFYPYPNPFGTDGDNSFADAWSPRGSILVLDVTMYEADGITVYKEGYYPIALPKLQRNKTYIIDEVKLTRVPGDKPYEPIETGESTVSISVHEWEEGLTLGTVTI